MRAIKLDRDSTVPKYRAIIEGQNFLFVHEDQSQHLDFHRTLCLEAECINSAREKALEQVMIELSAQEIPMSEDNLSHRVSLCHIEQIDIVDRHCDEQDFIWYFPEDAVFEHKLKQY